MGFYKVHLNKASIISDPGVILKADAIVTTDGWSSAFMEDLCIEERIIRETINRDTMFSSGPNHLKHPEYKKLKSLSETFISLKTNPHWLDINLVCDMIGMEILESERGLFMTQASKAIDRIVEYYDLKIQERREQKIDKILK